MNPDTQKPPQQNKYLQAGKNQILRIIFSRTTFILLALVLNFLIFFSILMPWMEKIPLLLGSMEVFTAAMLIHVLNSRDNPSIKLSWCIIIAVLPLFGTLLYWFTRFDLGYRLTKLVHREIRRTSAIYIPNPQPVMDPLKEKDREFYNLARFMYRHGGYPVYKNTRVQYFPLGEDKFAQMLVQLEKAEKFIFMEYFSIGPSYMWDRILEILKRKAGQGVEVRIVYDGSCAVTCLPYSYPKELAKYGIQVKVFAPFQPFLSTHYNNRDHRKILVIDGHTAFTGGVNIQDRYINRKQVYGHWKDTAVMVQGDAARSFTLMFLQMWNATEKEKVYAPYLLPSSPDSEARGWVIPYGVSPMDGEKMGELVYLNMIHQAKDYLYIMTPYLILDSEMVTALQFCAKRGVDVRVILPHIPDKKSAFTLAKSHYRELTEAGVKIYEYTPGFLHAKTFLSDDLHAVVGTINLDYRSLYLNHECAVYLYDVPALGDIRQDFLDTLSKSQLITPEDISRQSLFTRLTARLLKIIAPLM